MTKTVYITLHTMDERPAHSCMCLLLTKGATRGHCVDYSKEHDKFNAYDGSDTLEYAFTQEDESDFAYWIDLGEMWHV